MFTDGWTGAYVAPSTKTTAARRCGLRYVLSSMVMYLLTRKKTELMASVHCSSDPLDVKRDACVEISSRHAREKTAALIGDEQRG